MMADITLCLDDDCRFRKECRRHKDNGSGVFHIWQPYAVWPKNGPEDDPSSCDGWWPIDKESQE